MKLTELITKLEEINKVEGDIEVYVYVPSKRSSIAHVNHLEIIAESNDIIETKNALLLVHTIEL